MKNIILGIVVCAVICLSACGMVDGPGMENTDPAITSISEETSEFSSAAATEQTTAETTRETTTNAIETSESTTKSTTVTSADTEATEVTTEESEPAPVETPVTIFNTICENNETIVLSYYSIDTGETNSFEVNSEEFLGRCSYFIDSSLWSEFAYFPDIKNIFPELFRVTISVPDGSEKIEFSMFNNGGNCSYYTLYSNGEEKRNWDTNVEYSEFDFFHSLRREYFVFEMTNADPSVDGWYGPEGACEYFAKTAYFESRFDLSSGNDNRMVEFELISFEVTGVNADNTAVSGSMYYAFKPDNWESPMLMVGNTRIGTDEYVGYLTESRSFILQLGEDGRWHCTGIGTGGYMVT